MKARNQILSEFIEFIIYIIVMLLMLLGMMILGDDWKQYFHNPIAYNLFMGLLIIVEIINIMYFVSRSNYYYHKFEERLSKDLKIKKEIPYDPLKHGRA